MYLANSYLYWPKNTGEIECRSKLGGIIRDYYRPPERSEGHRALLTAEKVHNRISGEMKAQEVDEQLKRLLDMSLKGIISDEEYKQKKAELMSRKFDISEKGDSNGDWLEHLKNFLTLAHQASYIAAEANFEAQRDFLCSCGSNISLNNGSLQFHTVIPGATSSKTAEIKNGVLTFR